MTCQHSHAASLFLVEQTPVKWCAWCGALLIGGVWHQPTDALLHDIEAAKEAR